jgi:hypothetical protein
VGPVAGGTDGDRQRLTAQDARARPLTFTNGNALVPAVNELGTIRLSVPSNWARQTAEYSSEFTAGWIDYAIENRNG